MLNDIWTALSSAATSVVDWFSTLFTGMAELFYTPGAGEAAGSLTFIGVFAIIGLVVSVAFVIIKWISAFISLRRN